MNQSFIPFKGTCIPFPLDNPHKTMRDRTRTLVFCLLNLLDQLAKSSTTPCGMTQWTPNSEHTLFHNLGSMDTDTDATQGHEQFLKNYNMTWQVQHKYGTANEVSVLPSLQLLSYRAM